jgi:hypothetical protein
VYKDNLLIIEDYGTVQPTRQLSLNAAVFIVYQKLKDLYDCNSYQSMYKK